MADWQPIETAHKNGNHVLLYGEDWPGIAVGYWRETPFLAVGWVLHPYSDLHDVCEPTHWQPLPEPPK